MEVIFATLLCAVISIVDAVGIDSILLKNGVPNDEIVKSVVSLRKKNGNLIGSAVMVSLTNAFTAAEVIKGYEELTQTVPKYDGIFLMAGIDHHERFNIKNLEILKLPSGVLYPATNKIGLVEIEYTDRSSKMAVIELPPIPYDPADKKIYLVHWDTEYFVLHVTYEVNIIPMELNEKGYPPSLCINSFWAKASNDEVHFKREYAGSPLIQDGQVIGLLSYEGSSFGPKNYGLFIRVSDFSQFYDKARAVNNSSDLKKPPKLNMYYFNPADYDSPDDTRRKKTFQMS